MAPSDRHTVSVPAATENEAIEQARQVLEEEGFSEFKLIKVTVS